MNRLNLVDESHRLLGRAKDLWTKYNKGKASVEEMKLSTSLLNATRGTINTSIAAERWDIIKKAPKPIKKKLPTKK